LKATRSQPAGDPTSGPAGIGKIWRWVQRYAPVLNHRLRREIQPQAVRELKAQSPLDISVAGPTLAAQAIQTGLVDEHHLLVVPMMLGRGMRVLPATYV